MAQHGPSAYRDPGAVRPLICLANLGDRDGEPRPEVGTVSCDPALLRQCALIADALFADLHLLEPETGFDVPVVSLNWPFSGGAILRTYAAGGYFDPNDRAAVPPGIMVEVNRGLFVGDQTADTPIRPPDIARLSIVRRRLYQWAVRVVELLN